MLELVKVYSGNEQIVERVLFILANIVATQQLAREILIEELDAVDQIYNFIHPLTNIELLKKGFRLLANFALQTDPQFLAQTFSGVVNKLLLALDTTDEDMQFLALSCLTNYVYYDTPESPMITNLVR